MHIIISVPVLSPLIGHHPALHGRGHQQCDGDPLLRGGLLAQRDRGDHQGAGPGGQGEEGLRASRGQGGRGFISIETSSASVFQDFMVFWPFSIVIFVTVEWSIWSKASLFSPQGRHPKKAGSTRSKSRRIDPRARIGGDDVSQKIFQAIHKDKEVRRL